LAQGVGPTFDAGRRPGARLSGRAAAVRRRLGGRQHADAPAQHGHAAAVRAEVQPGVVHEPAHELDAAPAVGVARRLAAAARVADGDHDVVLVALEAHVDGHGLEVVAVLDGVLPGLVGGHDDAGHLV